MIPDYQTLMLPLLKKTSDGKEYTNGELIELLAKDFKLTSDELQEMLESSNQTVFYSRVNWAKTYLKQAGLLESKSRGTVRITDSGQATLQKKLDRIDNKYLSEIDKFLDFKNRKNAKNQHVEINQNDYTSQTPEEIIETVYQDFQNSLAAELLDKIRKVSPTFFEKLVVALLVKMGYGGSIKDAGKAVGKTGDEGIDGIIKEDKLGLDVIYIQAKRWKENNIIGRPEIHKFVGALAGQGTKKGIFITTSSFSKDALEYKPMNDTKVSRWNRAFKFNDRI